MKKRMFDLTICVLTAPIWIPMLITTALAIWFCEGFPIYYVSERRVWRNHSLRVIKFRTMVVNAEQIANRDTVPLQGVRFLNIPLDSPLYTPVGRLIERWHLTELPQFLHVLTGQMSVVGNRPLPENVLTSLKEVYPQAADRFLVKAGVTGLVQLIGRDNLPDEVRLALEIEYCRAVEQRYSVRLDLHIVLLTILITLGLHSPLSVQEGFSLIRRHAWTHCNSLVGREKVDIPGTRKTR